MKNFLMIVPAALLAACATTGASQKPVVDPMFEAQQRKIASLEAKLVELEARPAVQPAQKQFVQPVMVQQQMIPPPARPQISGPPQYFGWLNMTPYGCTSGPFRLQINNNTDYFVTLLVDGQEVKPRGAYNVLPHVPPKETVYLCLSSLGEHKVAGIAYATRMGVLAEVDTFKVNAYFDAHTMQGNGQSMDINDAVLWAN
jgi:hypothetical protein